MSLDGAVRWLESNRGEIRRLLDVYGALYVRGLPITNVTEFGRIRDMLIRSRASYREKATPRSEFGDDVYSSTDFPRSEMIRAHNENSYTLSFPGTLIFCCLDAADEGGATPVVDVRRVLRSIPESLVDKFRSVGWGLTRNYVDLIGLNWQTAFGTDNPADVAIYCDRNRIAYSWSDNGWLRTTQRRSALITHPRTGDEVWFNHVAFWSEWSLGADVREALTDGFGRENLPFNTSFGDGSLIGPDEHRIIEQAYERESVRESWQPGDLLIVDNLLAAHGREPFTGSRNILVAMGDPIDLAQCAPTVEPMGSLAGTQAPS